MDALWVMACEDDTRYGFWIRGSGTTWVYRTSIGWPLIDGHNTAGIDD
jgi:hypothetical protein